ncbi:MAG: FRG domain-containing protein [Bacteroidetes bacterium]|nr:FRG domain-containing protein [Bacteroidota bacterium]MCL6103307.1 FRG domain-containing protein [Bacteroidota bacterium]
MQLLPTTKHFKTVSELIKALSESDDNFRLPYERTDVNDSFFKPENDTFEVLINKKKEKILIPDSRQYPFLYRGQQTEFIPCLPTIYRGNPSDLQIFIERLRQIEFKKLLDQHPVVKGFFKRHNFRIDSIGLAQHYGLKTDILDLTNDLEIALFFALCPYCKENDYYKPISKGGSQTAILYVVIPSIIDFKTQTYFEDKISVIGLQPFARPGIQKGFCIHLKKEECFNAYKFTFNYTKSDSEYFYEKFEQGKKLWVKDILAEKAKIIASQTAFSMSTFKQTYEDYSIKGVSKNKLKKLLLESGISISTHTDVVRFSDCELREIVNKWNNEQINTSIHQIRRKFWQEKIEDKAGKRHEFRTLEMLRHAELLRLVGNRSGIEEDLNQENKNTSSSNHSSNKWSTGWQKVPGHFELIKSETFLEKKDCVVEL